MTKKKDGIRFKKSKTLTMDIKEFSLEEINEDLKSSSKNGVRVIWQNLPFNLGDPMLSKILDSRPKPGRYHFDPSPIGFGGDFAGQQLQVSYGGWDFAHPSALIQMAHVFNKNSNTDPLLTNFSSRTSLDLRMCKDNTEVKYHATVQYIQRSENQTPCYFVKYFVRDNERSDNIAAIKTMKAKEY
jgi:hypothetical protein